MRGTLLLIGLTLFALHTVRPALAAPAAEKPSAQEQDLINFSAGVHDGCLKGQKASGKSEKEQGAFCACLLSVFGQVPETDRQALMQRATADPAAVAADPAWLDKLDQLGSADCALVGKFDDTNTFTKEELARLSDPKAFDGFSLRLPRGFMAVPVQQQGPARMFGFARYHADMTTSTVLQVSLLDPPKPPSAEPTKSERERLLALLLEGISARRTDWSLSAPSEVEIGGLLFATADWSGKSEGRAMQGTMYAARKGNRVVMLAAQDLEPHSRQTIPLAKEVFRSFLLRATP